MTAAATQQERLLLRLEIDEFNSRYAAALDRGDLREWPRFFAEDPLYRITARENFDAGMPIGLMYCDSAGMMEDRVSAVLGTTVFAPRAIVHLITNVGIDGISDDGAVAAQANFLLVENLLDRDPRLLMSGRYVDRFIRREGRLLLKERHCVYDSAIIQTSTVYPV
jgi:3-phenylpropionate/cinnamic acid dioxygenase small subunit